jgi:phosphatidylserine decarboxylase
MRIDKAGIPFIAGALVPAAVLAGTRRYGWAAGFAGLGAFFAYFFRDPERTVPQAPGLVVSPADGRIVITGPADARWSPPGEWTQITIFLSPMDVHMNRTPVEGRVTRVEYREGTFLPAYKIDASLNELNEVWIDYHGEPVVIRQIVGVLARRIVCRVVEGQTLARGERIGLMKFGSRMDVFLPARAEILVEVGEHVVAGETVLARLLPRASSSTESVA